MQFTADGVVGVAANSFDGSVVATETDLRLNGAARIDRTSELFCRMYAVA